MVMVRMVTVVEGSVLKEVTWKGLGGSDGGGSGVAAPPSSQ